MRKELINGPEKFLCAASNPRTWYTASIADMTEAMSHAASICRTILRAPVFIGCSYALVIMCLFCDSALPQRPTDARHEIQQQNGYRYKCFCEDSIGIAPIRQTLHSLRIDFYKEEDDQQ